MLKVEESGPMAWTDDSLPADAGSVPVTESCLEEMMGIAHLLKANPLPTVALKPVDFDMPACRDMMNSVRQTLDEGVGFAMDPPGVLKVGDCSNFIFRVNAEWIPCMRFG